MDSEASGEYAEPHRIVDQYKGNEKQKAYEHRKNQ
jgi:hypothetical protein